MKYFVLICLIAVPAITAKPKNQNGGLQSRYDIPPGAEQPSTGSGN